ncbi:MAG: domain containing protein [Naasia sp.]|uniref:LamG-like jellyroll fold domain-containing protein n=1 Tax=Naasia sp. TaxID=2546198 RepID=UPI00261867BD|nr:LamG-like jellyroll fold domain-containing protein [Naasia sp.]MCU1570000.1 domain containing protein [Naasia sp.]
MAKSNSFRFRSLTVAAAISALVLGAISGAPAVADTAPASGTPETVSSDPLPTVQIDGIVWSQVIVGNTVYAGGKFANARPAGAAAGTNLTPRSNLLAYNLTTGALITSFAPTVNGEVKSVAASPDGTRLYIGGLFTVVNGLSRSRVAAFNIATGALVSNFRPVANTTVETVKATNSTVYLGGNFTAIGSTGRIRSAAISASTGAVLPFAPVADKRVRAITISPDGSKVVLGGNFTTLNGSGNPGYGLAAVDAVTGALLPWAVNSKVRDAGDDAAIWSLNSDSDSVYGTGYHFGAGGNLEGTFRSDWSGNLIWVEDCHGDTYSSAVSNGVVYIAGHPHYCGTSGGFPQTTPTWTVQRAMAWTKALSGRTANNNTLGYASWVGTPLPSMLNWWPDFITGKVSGSGQAAWSVAANSQYVVYGGEFPGVNSRAQQGLVRFAVKSIAPNDDGPRLKAAAFVPTLKSPGAGTVEVSWLANYDRDNQVLSYDLIRDGSVLRTVSQASRIWWDRPQMTYLDTAVAAGSTHTYQLRATDPFGNTALGDPVSITVATGAALSNYAKAVLSDGAAHFWRLNEKSGTALTDTAGTNDAVAGSGVVLNRPGAISGDSNTAATFSGTSAGVAVAQRLVQAPDTFSVEAWFSTVSKTGGKIVGFGEKLSGDSTFYDRHVYLDGTGRIYFGVLNPAKSTVQSASGFNDGKWHHVVATLSSAGMRLYVDGAQAASRTDVTYGQNLAGYWRIGGDSTWTGAKYLAGGIDEVAVYNKEISAATVNAHYVTGKGSTPPPVVNLPPAASFTTSVSGASVAVDGSASTDADGTITKYAWEFGDGGTGLGATTDHTYAASGTYTVKLTVTDDSAATGSTTQSVTVTVPPPPADDVLAADDFNRTTSSGWGSATRGGPWTFNAASTPYSTDGSTGNISTSTAGRTLEAYLQGVSSSSSDVQATFTLGAVPAGGNAQVSVIARRVTGSGDYRVRATVTPAGAVSLQLQGPGMTSPAAASGITYTSDMKLRIRIQAEGVNPTLLRAKIWVAGTAEPANWLTSKSDTTAALQVAGFVGLMNYLGGGVTTVPAVIRFDDFTANQLP